MFKKKNPLTLTLKTPDSVSTEDISLEAELMFVCTGAATIQSVMLRLRGDLVDRKKAPSAAPYHYLGEITATPDLKMAPNQPEKIALRLPLDFSGLNAYEIPPENLAVASEEMK
ncbi:MAG TPA: hypothetical protein VHD60_04630, partial [Candidatus Saccharimonadales bacterium]|nr:hypothetical protein [Candidatus Saccharimonadales bacterium]